MNAIDLIRTATGNLARSRLRTVLTALAIVVASFVLTLTAGVGAGISRYIDDTVAALGDTASMEVTRPLADTDGGPPPYEGATGVRGSFGATNQTLDDDDFALIVSLPHVAEAEPVLPIDAAFIQVSGAAEKYVAGLSAAVASRTQQLVAGAAPRVDAAEVVIPKAFHEALGFAHPADAVGAEVLIGFRNAAGQEQTVPATISGVLEAQLAPTPNPIGSPLLVRQVYDAQTDGLSDQQLPGTPAVSVTLAEGATDADIAELQEALEAEGLVGTTAADRLGLFATVIDVITAILIGFAVVALVAASFGIVNTLLMSVQERTREIGLLKAHGMTPRAVFGLFSLEAVGLGVLGALVGSLLGIGVGLGGDALVAERYFSDLPGLRAFAVDPIWQAVIVAVVIAVAFVAGTLPARRAARRDPIAALRYE